MRKSAFSKRERERECSINGPSIRQNQLDVIFSPPPHEKSGLQV
jgi:hypothetical protein